MALPLPKVVADTLPGGGLVTSMRGMNALANDQMENVVKGAEADYAPYTTYANAASKIAYANLLPYQVQAEVMSNPMVWAGLQQLQKNNPAAANKMMNALVQSIPSPGQMINNAGMPPLPQQKSGGLLNALGDLLGLGGKSGGQPNANPMAQIPQPPSQPTPNALAQPGGDNSGYSYNPDGTNVVASPNEVSNAGTTTPDTSTTGLVPGAQGMGAGIMGEKTIGFTEQPNTPGKAFVNAQGDVASAPSESNITQAQQALQALNDVQKDLKFIAAGAPHWLEPGMEGKIKAMEKLNWVRKHLGDIGGAIPALMKSTGITTKELSQYNEWKSKQKAVEERLARAFQFNNNEQAQRDVAAIIEPTPGEGEEYGQRVNNELKQLITRFAPSYRKTLGGGYILQPNTATAKPATPNAPFQASPDGSVSNAQVRQAIQNTAKNEKAMLIKVRGPDPKDNNKIKTWQVPEGVAQQYIDNGYKRVP